MDSFKFPKDFELGVASAATQIEGGNAETNWHAWANAGHVKDGSSPAVADMHWEYWKEDTKLMAKLGIKHSRIGIEWARVEPYPGVFDDEAIDHYIQELQYMKKLGIEPLVTLHHFSNPMWFEHMGSWENRENMIFWLEFVKKVVKAFGDLCNLYITINEPNVYAMSGWFDGSFPPGKKDMNAYINVLSNMVPAHIRAYQLIKEINPEAKVSVAMHVCVFTPLRSTNPGYQSATKFIELAFQSSVSKAMATGVVIPPLIRRSGVKRGQYCDFWGLNYYSRQTISGFREGTMPGSRINDLGWEIYPEGIASCAKKLYDILPCDIYVTENGTCDNHDNWRSRYIYDHLRVALNSGLPIKRYYHWCFIDNFEWSEGQKPRFGLVYNDYSTQTRTVKDSGLFYSELIKNRGCTQRMYDKYVKGQEYKEH